MKKIISIMLCVGMLLSFVACSGNGSENGQQTADNTAAPTEAPTPGPTAVPTADPTLTPDPLAGYDAHDYGILRSFFELTDENGITNGEKCFNDYDPDDPATWTGGTNNTDRCIIWNASGKLRGINLRSSGDEPVRLTGRLEFSSFDKLEAVFVWNTVFEEFTAEDLPAFGIRSNNTDIQLPFVEGEAILRGGYIDRIYLRSASHVRCELTGEAESNVSNLPCFTIDITVDGGGYAGVVAFSDENYYVVRLSAEPKDGARFIGWFNAAGELISAEADFELTDPATGTFPAGSPAEFICTARFE
ncbi:MAG: PT domain-containing protein [Clostridia bacterium]|nr:PT domain-containing protein [Clostridia bacterium]